MKKLHPQTVARIVKMGDQKVRPPDIARALQVSSNQVRKILRNSR